MKHECIGCSAQFEVTFDDDDFTVKFCPNCGQELLGEIELVDDIDPELLYDEFDE